MLFWRRLGAAGHVIGVHVNDRKKRGRARRGGTSPRNKTDGERGGSPTRRRTLFFG